MDKTLNFILALVVVFYVIDYVKKQDSKPIGNNRYQSEIDRTKQGKKKSNSSTPSRTESNADENISDEVREHRSTPTIYVRALGNVDNSDLVSTSEIIQDFYGFNVVIKSQVDVTSSMLNSSGYLNSMYTCMELDGDVKTIYITENLLYDNNDILLRGTTSGDNNTIVVRGETRFLRETVIHELGHAFGLDHCEDLTCVMAVANDAYDSGDFCNKCKNNIVY